MSELRNLIEIIRECEVEEGEYGYVFVDPQGTKWAWTEIGAVSLQQYWDRYGHGYGDEVYDIAMEYIQAWAFSLDREVHIEIKLKDGRVLQIEGDGKDKPSLQVIERM